MATKEGTLRPVDKASISAFKTCVRTSLKDAFDCSSGAIVEKFIDDVHLYLLEADRRNLAFEEAS